MRNIAIIPARSGSQGIKDKNIRMLHGKPLIAYTIQAALESGIFDTVMVSTDSGHYADIACQYGAEVPFLRTAQLAADNASSWDVVKEVLKKYKEKGETYDNIMLLQPTSPLRNACDIVSAYRFMKEKDAEAVVSVCKVDHSPEWCNVLSEDLNMDHFINHKNQMPRQQLNTYYRINGAIYLVKEQTLWNRKTIYNTGCFAYIMDRRKSIDIDEEIDFEMAEFLMNK